MSSAFLPGFDKTLAVGLIDACILDYVRFQHPEQPIEPPPGYDVKAVFVACILGKDESFGFLMSSSTDAILAFRGTMTFADDITDIRHRQVRYPYPPHIGWTHAGFTRVYVSIRDSVNTAVTALPKNMNLYVTGHSLGGAVALLATMDITSDPNCAKPTMYTFAGPRVGNPAFVGRFDQEMGSDSRRSWRVVNVNDIVPRHPYKVILLPPARYEHVQSEFQLDFDHGSVKLNHDQNKYKEALEMLP